MIAKLIKFVFAGFMLVVGGSVLLVGGLFVLRLVTADTADARFDAPNGKWSLHIEETCLHGPCYKYPALFVDEGWFQTTELQCDLAGADTTRVLFDSVVATEWENDDTVFNWTAGEPPVSGRIDLKSDCYITAIHDDRFKQTSIRFRENCLIAGCLRSAWWIEWRGGFVYTTPCSVTAMGDVAVFTVPGDPRGQIDVTINVDRGTADWRSTETGQTGTISFAEDCDLSRQTKELMPA